MLVKLGIWGRVFKVNGRGKAQGVICSLLGRLNNTETVFSCDLDKRNNVESTMRLIQRVTDDL
jgi:hypothetical protein